MDIIISQQKNLMSRLRLAGVFALAALQMLAGAPIWWQFSRESVASKGEQLLNGEKLIGVFKSEDDE